MKVFLSWSGQTSHSIAKILRDWLPAVIQSIEPYVSSEDIDKGARWSSDIAGELDASAYGIICLTKENLGAPWINFEAGALGKSVEKSRVSPVLFNLLKSDLKGPLVQFQATVFERDDMQRLLHSLNNAAADLDESLEPARLEKAFDRWWPDLDGQLKGIACDSSAAAPAQSPNDGISSILEELLDLTRANHKILRDPGTHLWPSEMYDDIRDLQLRSTAYSKLIMDLSSMVSMILRYAEDHRTIIDNPAYLKLLGMLDELRSHVTLVERRLAVAPRKRGSATILSAGASVLNSVPLG